MTALRVGYRACTPPMLLDGQAPPPIPAGSLLEYYDAIRQLWYSLRQDQEFYFPFGGHVLLDPAALAEAWPSEVERARRRADELGIRFLVTPAVGDARIELARYGPPAAIELDDEPEPRG